MRTDITITAAYNNAKSTATELESIASDLIRLANLEYENILASLCNVWQGENSERFVKKGRVVKEQLLNTAKNIRGAAAELLKDAKTTYNAEMRALEIVREEEKRLLLEKEEAAEKAKGSAGNFGGGGGGSR
ncbi:MAG: hypothetical protein IKB07_11095 [Lachnospiraceae bacterium]|nr:hypothetical protein [Lachnospiraceae bacterium]